MKLQCNSNLIANFSDFDKHTPIIKEYLASPANLSKHLLQSKVYTIDPYCLRPYFPKVTSSNNIRNRFFECQECTRYKLQQDLVELCDYQNFEVISYNNIIPSSHYEHRTLSNDVFTTRVLINHYLNYNKIKGINYPIHAFICGIKAYLYYFERFKAYNLISLLKSLAKYKFSFNSIPKGLSCLKGERNKFDFIIPDLAAITTNEGIRIRNNCFNDFIFTEKIEYINKDSFKLDLSTDRHRLKFKYLRDAGLLNKRVNLNLNLMLYQTECENYDSFLNEISNKELKFQI